MSRTYNPAALTGDFKVQFDRFGGLTAAQIDSLQERIAAPVQAKVINVDHIVQAFQIARQNGVRRPKVRVQGYLFKFAPEVSANPGALYVIEDTQGFEEYLGKIVGNVFSPARACTPEHKQAILAAAADPLEAILAFGRATGKCSICGRPLTDPESIANSVGPVCRAKFGF